VATEWHKFLGKPALEDWVKEIIKDRLASIQPPFPHSDFAGLKHVRILLVIANMLDSPF
jgi:hypothetical protein